jgi:hypothetical protein
MMKETPFTASPLADLIYCVYNDPIASIAIENILHAMMENDPYLDATKAFNKIMDNCNVERFVRRAKIRMLSKQLLVHEKLIDEKDYSLIGFIPYIKTEVKRLEAQKQLAILESLE